MPSVGDGGGSSGKWGTGDHGERHPGPKFSNMTTGTHNDGELHLGRDVSTITHSTSIYIRI